MICSGNVRPTCILPRTRTGRASHQAAYAYKRADTAPPRIPAAPQRDPDMPTSILTYRDRAKSRFRENLRQATLEGADHTALRDLIQAVVDDTISIDAANKQLLALRRKARDTRDQAAA